MDRAINKSTNQIVSAFEIFSNGSYQNLDSSEWIAPQDSITNLEELEKLGISEVKVHYVSEKEYKNYNGTLVSCAPFFAVYPNSPANTSEESPEHKMLKNWLFNRLKNNDLEIVYSRATKKYKYNNKNKLSELNIDWNNYSIEVPIRSRKNLRADILIPFKVKHPLLGFGIIIEIQISKQNERYTYDRSLDRALSGYSTMWLFENDFNIIDDEIELLKNELIVYSFSSELKYNGKNFIKQLKEEVEEQCRLLDKKKNELIEQIKIFDYKKEQAYKEIMSRLQTREAILFEKINLLENNPFKGIVENSKDLMKKEFANMSLILLNDFNLMLNKLNYPLTFGECKKCKNGFLVYGKTKTGKERYSCSNWKNGCDNTIWLNNQ